MQNLSTVLDIQAFFIYKSPEPGDKLPMGFKSIMRIDRGIEWLYKFASHLKL